MPTLPKIKELKRHPQSQPKLKYTLFYLTTPKTHPTTDKFSNFKAMDKLTKEQRRKNMQAVKATGSKIETTLAKELWRLGHRYRKNDKTVFGKPDLTLKRYKLAIFVDSEFWHGKDWTKRKHDHKTNQDFWHKKIERNKKRDKEVNAHLLKDGWKVLRFWGQDVTKNLRTCTDKITLVINETKRENKH